MDHLSAAEAGDLRAKEVLRRGAVPVAEAQGRSASHVLVGLPGEQAFEDLD